MQAAAKVASKSADDTFRSEFNNYNNWRIVIRNDVVGAAVAHRDGTWFAWDHAGEVGQYSNIGEALNAIHHNYKF